VSKLPFGYVKIRDQDGEHIEQHPEEAFLTMSMVIGPEVARH